MVHFKRVAEGRGIASHRLPLPPTTNPEELLKPSAMGHSPQLPSQLYRSISLVCGTGPQGVPQLMPDSLQPQIPSKAVAVVAVSPAPHVTTKLNTGSSILVPFVPGMCVSPVQHPSGGVHPQHVALVAPAA